MNKQAGKYLLLGGLGALVFVSFRTIAPLDQDPSWKAPKWTDTLKSPIQASAVVLQAGKKLYDTYCQSCHGKTGLGDGAPGMTFKVKPANFHDRLVKNEREGALFWKMSTGKDAMPAYGKSLTAKQRWQLVAYVRQLSSPASRSEIAAKSGRSLPLSDYAIDPKMVSPYFPVPKKVLNVTKSESQLFMVDTVLSGLVRPWSFVFLPDHSVLIAERSGKLLIVRDGKVQANSVGGDVPVELRDVKLHPQFEKNRLIYYSYYIDPVKDPAKPDGGYTVIMRAKLENDQLVEPKMLYKTGPFNENAYWYGSKMVFDQQGYLYFTVGQRTLGTRDKWSTPQDKSVSSGKIMRLKDDGSIPPDNPFVDSAGSLPEIYSYGHRQPEGLVCDPETGRIWENEHGEMGGCELNLLQSGGNYGWPLATFSLNYNGTIITKDTSLPGMISPVHYWIPSLAPAGMDFVDGNRYPGWNGNLFVSSLVQKMVNRSVMKNNHVIHDEKLLPNIGRVRDLKYGPDQFLYVVTEDTGVLVRLIPLTKKTPVVKKPVK
jgi:glucose/arabinose dehydrogenase/cytochrome c5